MAIKHAVWIVVWVECDLDLILGWDKFDWLLLWLLVLILQIYSGLLQFIDTSLWSFDYYGIGQCLAHWNISFVQVDHFTQTDSVKWQIKFYRCHKVILPVVHTVINGALLCILTWTCSDYFSLGQSASDWKWMKINHKICHFSIKMIRMIVAEASFSG